MILRYLIVLTLLSGEISTTLVHGKVVLEKAIDGIIRRKQECIKNGKGFGAQFLQFDKPSYTISARYWKDGYDALGKYSDDVIRRLTITELKRIQSFPDDYEIIGTNREIIMQIGNAVPCNFAKHLGLHLIKILQHLIKK